VKHPARVRKIAREQFGYTQLWPGQEEAIVSVLQGRDTLAAMPPKSGKSAIYEVPALMLPGPTVVVSPFPAVPRHSVNHAEANGVDAGIRYLTAAEFDRDTLSSLRSARPSLFVVEEAHCISEGGQGSRPDYRMLGEIIAELGRPVVVALTSTSHLDVRTEIIHGLRMRDPVVIVRGWAGQAG